MDNGLLPLEQQKEYLSSVWNDSTFFLVSKQRRIKNLKCKKEGAIIKGGKFNLYAMAVALKIDKYNIASHYLCRCITYLLVQKPEGFDFVIHKDYDYNNNRDSNLNWVIDVDKYWHRLNLNKKNNLNVKLSENQVIRLKRILNNPNLENRYKAYA